MTLKPQSDAQRAACLPWVREQVAGLLLLVKDPATRQVILDILAGRVRGVVEPTSATPAHAAAVARAKARAQELPTPSDIADELARYRSTRR